MKVMRTINEITICGDPEVLAPRVFQIASDIQDWPKILPHYRYMRILERSESHKLADFGATRDWIPVHWTAWQEIFPDAQRITFEHVRGVTKGMFVEWNLEKRADGVVVKIDHQLSMPVIGPLFADWLVGKLFVQNIAGKTLKCIKSQLEAGD